MIRPTREIAMAAAQDEGNRSARATGRAAWNEEDWLAACAVFNRLYPPPDED